jgi:hypothetical protein
MSGTVVEVVDDEVLVVVEELVVVVALSRCSGSSSGEAV